MQKFKKSKTLADHNKQTAKLNLKITNFGQQNIVPVNDIVEHINLIPDFHLEKLKEILFDPQRLTPQLINNIYQPLDTKTKGAFIQSHRLIVIFDIQDKNQLYHILFHELGHHVYFLVIDQVLKMKWVKDICRNDKFVTPYASRNAAEDFAESYATYLIEPHKLKSIPLKYNFMRRHVFEDVALILNNNQLDFRA